MEFKIVEYWLKNPTFSIISISKLLNISEIEVESAIKNYKNNPYIIRQSKINYESI
jgi:hypothetical protein